MIRGLLFAAALACQQPASPPAAVIDWSFPNSETPAPATPPKPSTNGDLGFGSPTRTGGDFLRSQAQPPATPGATPSVADLFRERNAREAAARAAAEAPAAPADGTYLCRKTDNGVVCGNNEESMKQSEEAARAMLDRLTTPN